MQITINTSEALTIDWGAKGVTEIVQNVFTLINTFKYEVAYDRTLGVAPDFIDLPQPEAITLATTQIYSVIDEREPRATIKDVSFLGLSEDGDMIFKVVIDI
ncbi:hypothetical protein E0485_21835 [Paenibacillus albiflavus]|uniref:IraD/Gp25-like domain-containing protein n=1 Tax=Paenibacillus albiflavus TaxID=2545760 RepID=A0A4V2WMX2_9BACL|nr:hypothetical protein [Paenibacillus albiflavus]TCZ73062.1 hypothetical protein E0485_21835 [Paenibacillus albiflavus]